MQAKIRFARQKCLLAQVLIILPLSAETAKRSGIVTGEKGHKLPEPPKFET
jgi:hypothetical protein